MFVCIALNPAVESPASFLRSNEVPDTCSTSTFLWIHLEAHGMRVMKSMTSAQTARFTLRLPANVSYHLYLNSGKLVLLVGVLLSYVRSLKCMIQWHLFKDSVPCKNAIPNLAGWPRSTTRGHWPQVRQPAILWLHGWAWLWPWNDGEMMMI